jgi:hypothetical protein
MQAEILPYPIGLELRLRPVLRERKILEDISMKRFLVFHKVPSEMLTPEKIKEMGSAMRDDPEIKGYRSFINATEGRGVCVFDAPDSDALGRWLSNLGLPYDSIMEVEIEGERGQFTDLREKVGVSTGSKI